MGATYYETRSSWKAITNDSTSDKFNSFFYCLYICSSLIFHIQCVMLGRSLRMTIEIKPVVYRGGGTGPAGPAKAGPLFRGSLVSFPDCRDNLRTRRLGEVSHASLPLPCVYAFLIIVHALLPVDQEPGAARTDCISTHCDSTSNFYCRTLPVVDCPPPPPPPQCTCTNNLSFPVA